MRKNFWAAPALWDIIINYGQKYFAAILVDQT